MYEMKGASKLWKEKQWEWVVKESPHTNFSSQGCSTVETWETIDSIWYYWYGNCSTSEIAQWENVLSPGCHFCHVVCWTCKKRYRCALSIQIGTCLKSYLHGSIPLEMILNCYCSCRYTLGSTDWAYVCHTRVLPSRWRSWQAKCESVSATLRDFASTEFEFVQWWRIRKWRNDNLYSVTRWNTAIKTPDDLFNVHPRKQGVSRVRITSRISLDAIVLRNSVYSLVLESGI